MLKTKIKDYLEQNWISQFGIEEEEEDGGHQKMKFISFEQLISEKFRQNFLQLMLKELKIEDSNDVFNNVDNGGNKEKYKEILELLSKPFRKSSILAEKFRNEGNQQFKNCSLWKSLIYYNMALCNSSIGTSSDSCDSSQSQIALVYGNRSIVYAKIGQLDNAIADIDRSIGHHYESAQSSSSSSTTNSGTESIEANDLKCRTHIKKLLLRKLSHLIEAGRWKEAKVVENVITDDHLDLINGSEDCSKEREYFEQCKQKIMHNLQLKHYNTINNSGRTRATVIGALSGSKSGCLKLLQVSGGFTDNRKIRLPMTVCHDQQVFDNGGSFVRNSTYNRYHRISYKIQLDPRVSDGFRYVVTSKSNHKVQIERSELLLLESPLTFVCLEMGLHCANCLVNLSRTTTVPCRSCNQFQYCSDRCESKLWSSYHQLECSQIGVWNRLRPVGALTLRLFQKLSNRTNSFKSIVRDLGLNDDNENCSTTLFDISKLLESMFLLDVNDSNTEKQFNKKIDLDTVSQLIFDTHLIQSILDNGNLSNKFNFDKSIQFQLVLAILAIVDESDLNKNNQQKDGQKRKIVEKIYENLPIQFCSNIEDGLLPRSIQKQFQTVDGLRTMFQNSIHSNQVDDPSGFVLEQSKKLLDLLPDGVLPRQYRNRTPVALALYPTNRFMVPFGTSGSGSNDNQIPVSTIYNGKIRALRSRCNKTIHDVSNDDHRLLFSIVDNFDYHHQQQTTPPGEFEQQQQQQDLNTQVYNLAFDLSRWNYLWDCSTLKQDKDEVVPRPGADGGGANCPNEQELRKIDEIKDQLLILVNHSDDYGMSNWFRLMLLSNTDCWIKQKRSQYGDGIQILKQCIQIIDQLIEKHSNNENSSAISDCQYQRHICYLLHLKQQFELRIAHFQFELFTDRQLKVTESVQASIQCLLQCSELVHQIYSGTFPLTLIGNDIDQDDDIDDIDYNGAGFDPNDPKDTYGSIMLGNESSMSAKDCLLKNNFPLLIELEDMMVACDIFSRQFASAGNAVPAAIDGATTQNMIMEGDVSSERLQQLPTMQCQEKRKEDSLIDGAATITTIEENNS